MEVITTATAASKTRQALGLAKTGASRPGAETETGEPADAGDRGAEREQPRSGVRGRDRAEQHHGVQVDVRVEPGEGERRQQRPSRSGSARCRPAGATVSAAGRIARRTAWTAYTSSTPAPSRVTTARAVVCRAMTAPDPGGADGDQQHVADRADGDDHPDVLAPDALPQHVRVLGADGDDESEAEAEAGEQGDHVVDARCVRR